MATHLTTDDAGRSWWTMAGAVVVVLAMTVLAGRSLWLTGNPVPLYASAAFVTGVAFGRGVERWRRMALVWQQTQLARRSRQRNRDRALRAVA